VFSHPGVGGSWASEFPLKRGGICWGGGGVRLVAFCLMSNKQALVICKWGTRIPWERLLEGEGKYS